MRKLALVSSFGSALIVGVYLDEEYFVVGFDIPVLGGFAGINAPLATYGVTFNYEIE